MQTDVNCYLQAALIIINGRKTRDLIYSQTIVRAFYTSAAFDSHIYIFT